MSSTASLIVRIMTIQSIMDSNECYFQTAPIDEPIGWLMAEQLTLQMELNHLRGELEKLRNKELENMFEF